MCHESSSFYLSVRLNCQPLCISSAFTHPSLLSTPPSNVARATVHLLWLTLFFVFYRSIVALHVVLIAAVPQCESAICIHIFPQSSASLPPPTCTAYHPCRSSQITRLRSLCCTAASYFTRGSMSMVLSQFISPFPSTSVLWLTLTFLLNMCCSSGPGYIVTFL